LCLDGTGNIWGNGHDTNVVKIAALGSLVVYLPVVAGLSYIQAKRDVA